MGEHLPCKQGVKGSNPFISTQDNILKCTLKTAYRTNIYASIAFDDLIIRRYTARYETTSRSCFLDKHESKTNVNRENNKTMYLLKIFNTDTLVSVKLKRTIMSYLKYR